VLLPTPLRPRSAVKAPGFTASERLRNTAVSPRVTLKLLAINILSLLHPVH
jgi:hypothetical protein